MMVLIDYVRLASTGYRVNAGSTTRVFKTSVLANMGCTGASSLSLIQLCVLVRTAILRLCFYCCSFFSIFPDINNYNGCNIDGHLPRLVIHGQLSADEKRVVIDVRPLYIEINL